MLVECIPLVNFYVIWSIVCSGMTVRTYLCFCCSESFYVLCDSLFFLSLYVVEETDILLAHSASFEGLVSLLIYLFRDV